ncbi:MAG: hypothetical protein H7Z43_14365, partial [Clostridia bacterium]|nr:hypothetical protein [Deltaproteobacteria bacterium]
MTVPARADTIRLVGAPSTGRVQFVFTGASLVDAAGRDNGVNCSLKQAIATVRASDLPVKPRIKQATLYVGGSLFDDGVDYQPSTSIFDTGGVSFITDPDLVTARARAAVDTQVSLKLPGSFAPLSLAASQTPAITVFYKNDGNETGNIAFFTSKFDITAQLIANGTIAGDYVLSDAVADICLGTEALCDNGESCDTVTGNGTVVQGAHTNAAASFALLFVVEDDALPLRTVGIFEGMEQVSGQRGTVTLDTVNPVSSPAAGRFAFYALEGDRLLYNSNPGNTPCGAEEFISVRGSDDAAKPQLCLVDDDNPLGNIFNSTINTEAQRGTDPTCNDAPTCCSGNGLCNVIGVDIDRFDISAALDPGAQQVTVNYGTGTDRIAMSVMLLEVDVFQPTLKLDSQVRVLDAINGIAQLGGPITYSIAVSNTGNVTSHAARAQMPMPPFVTGFTIVAIPAGSVDESSPGGGVNGTGNVFVRDFDVPPGEVREIRVQVTTRCDAVSRSLDPIAVVSSTEEPAFDVPAEVVLVAGPGIAACDGQDANGGFNADPLLKDRVLRGGGGCNAAGPSCVMIFFGGLLAFVSRKKRAYLMLLVAFCAGCRDAYERKDPGAKDTSIANEAAIAGVACPSSPDL